MKIDSDNNSEGSTGYNLGSDSECKSLDNIDMYRKLKMFDPLTDKVQLKDFILVKFFARSFIASKPVLFIGLTGKIEDKEVNVCFLKRKDESWNFIFPEIEDASAVDLNDIVLRLPSPTTGP